MPFVEIPCVNRADFPHHSRQRFVFGSQKLMGVFAHEAESVYLNVQLTGIANKPLQV